MLGFVNYLTKTQFQRRYDAGDWADQLHYFYSSWLFAVLALFLFGRNYVGQPIQCWVPPQFTGAWEKYTETYCYIKNTYYLPLHENIPDNYGERDAREIGYYQWVPIVLIIQAIMFWLPSMVWRMLNKTGGFNVKTIMNKAAGERKKFARKEELEPSAELAAGHIRETLDTQRELRAVKTSPISQLTYGKWYGTYLNILYLFIKLLYLINVIAQFFIMNEFLRTDYTWWGAGILNDVLHGRSWQESGHFPRVTMCDFHIRVLGNVHRHTVQCVLMINMFNEKIYIFLWWWVLFVGVVTAVNFVYWALQLFVPGERRAFVERYLRVKGCVSSGDAAGKHRDLGEMNKVNNFVDKFLRPDGVLLLRMIQINGGDLLTGEVTSVLWHKFSRPDSADYTDDSFAHQQLHDAGAPSPDDDNKPLTPEKASAPAQAS